MDSNSFARSQVDIYRRHAKRLEAIAESLDAAADSYAAGVGAKAIRDEIAQFKAEMGFGEVKW